MLEPTTQQSSYEKNNRQPENINKKLKKYNKDLNLSEYDDFMRDEVGVLRNLHDLFSNPDLDEESERRLEIEATTPELSVAMSLPQNGSLHKKILNGEDNHSVSNNIRIHTKINGNSKHIKKNSGNIDQETKNALEQYFLQAYQNRDSDTIQKVDKLREYYKNGKMTYNKKRNKHMLVTKLK